VRTGRFDPDVSTRRIRALTESVKLELQDTLGKDESRAFNPYERAPGKDQSRACNPYERAPAKDDSRVFTPYARAPAKAKPRADEPASGDPYSSGPARRPEDISFNPYERPRGRKP